MARSKKISNATGGGRASSGSKIDDFNQLIEEIEGLKVKLESARKSYADCTLMSKMDEMTLDPLAPTKMACAHILKAHNSRIHDVVWSPDDSRLISVGSENCVVFWAVKSGYIDNLVDAALQQPLTADVSPDLGTLYCGGLCANVAVYQANRKGEAKDEYTEYNQTVILDHDSRVQCIKYVSTTNELVTAAETEGVCIWDMNTMKIKSKYRGHVNQVNAMKLLDRAYVFLTGGADGTVKLWDTRISSGSGGAAGSMVASFEGHEADVTCLDIFPNRTNFISGSDDTYCQLLDTRYDEPIARYSDPVWRDMDMQKESMEQQAGCLRPDLASVATVAVTRSGRMFLSGCADSIMYYWDVLQPDRSAYQREESGPVRKIVFSNGGQGLASVLWDNKNRLRILIPS